MLKTLSNSWETVGASPHPTEKQIHRKNKKATESYAPSPLWVYAAAAAAFSGFMGARVEMACL